MNQGNQNVDVHPGMTMITLSAATYHGLLTEFSEGLQAAARTKAAQLFQRVIAETREQDDSAEIVRRLCVASQRGGYFQIAVRNRPGSENPPELVAMVHIRPFTLVVS